MSSTRAPKPARHSVRGPLPDWAQWAVTLAAIGLIWFFLYVRVIPSPSRTMDTGIFVSVAERLRAGDILYVTVWDNKDPLFYWALALWLGLPHGLLWCELMWLSIACLSAAAIARRCGEAWRGTIFTGGALAPLVFTGASYFPGMSHLPGTALTLAAIACAWWGWWAVAGVFAVLLLATKLIYLPVLALALILLLLRDRSRAHLIRFSIALAVSGLIFAAILARRNEFRGYLRAQWLNVSYSNQDRVFPHQHPAFIEHLVQVFSQAGVVGGSVTLVALALIVLIGWARRGDVHRDPTSWLLGTLLAATTFGGIVVLALTGIWEHHLQILYVPGALASIAAFRVARHLFPAQAFTRSMLALGTAFLISGGQLIGWYPHDNADVAGGLWQEIAGPSPDANHFYDLDKPRRFAHLGVSDHTAFARGLDHWQLVCPRMMQYQFNPDSSFDEMDRCLPEADVIFVESSYGKLRGTKRTDAFVTRTDTLLEDHYRCVFVGYNEVCTRRP